MISATMIAWGSLTMLTALVHTPGQLYLVRFMLGAAEAGFFPGVIVYLSHWFTHADRAKATSNLWGDSAVFGLGSPMAGWILGREWLAIAGMAVAVRGRRDPAILLGMVAVSFLTDRPERSGLARSRAAAMDSAKVARRKDRKSQSVRLGRRSGSPHLLLAGVNLPRLFRGFTALLSGFRPC